MDLKSVCRTCLRIPKNSINLFENSDNLLQKIKDIFSLQIENVSELPAHICEECFNLINISSNFKKVVLNADIDLNTRLKTLKETNYLVKRKRTTSDSFPAVNIKTEPNRTEINDNVDDTTRSKTKKSKFIKYNRKVYKCNICNEQFTTSLRLNTHKRTNHGPKGVCNICGIEIRLDNMARHVLKHNGKPERCDVCGKLCKHVDALRAHKYYQHREKICACEVCGATFTMLCALKSHMIHHNDPHRRRKTCHICGTTVNSLKKHMLTHTGERPYRCTYCDKGFTSGHALKVHTRLHTNERPYVCTHCDASYPQIVSLRTHLKSKHGITNT